jgi:hypothetical protein
VDFSRLRRRDLRDRFLSDALNAIVVVSFVL